MIAGLVFLGIGVLLLTFWFWLRRRIQRTMNWEQTSGSVIESRLERSGVGEDIQVNAHLVYSYTVNGTPLRASSVNVFGFRTAFGIVRKYPVGTAVNVYFDPASPGSAVLERGGRAQIWVLIFALAYFAGALAFLARFF